MSMKLIMLIDGMEDTRPSTTQRCKDGVDETSAPSSNHPLLRYVSRVYNVLVDELFLQL